MSQQNDNGIKTFRAGVAIGQFVRVKLVSGVLQIAGAGEVGIGITQAEAFAANDPIAVKLWSAPGTFKMIASAAITSGAEVKPMASGKCDDSGTDLSLGVALEAASANGDIIEVVPVRVFDAVTSDSIVADSADHENTTTEAAFDKSVPIAANSVAAGDCFHIRAAVNVSDNNGSDTLTLRVLMGTVELVTTAAVDVADADVGYFDIMVTIRTIGASGTLVATGVQALGVPGTVTAKPFRKGSTTIDTTAAMDITVLADWSAAHADNECNLESLTVQRFRG